MSRYPSLLIMSQHNGFMLTGLYPAGYYRYRNH